MVKGTLQYRVCYGFRQLTRMTLREIRFVKADERVSASRVKLPVCSACATGTGRVHRIRVCVCVCVRSAYLTREPALDIVVIIVIMYRNGKEKKKSIKKTITHSNQIRRYVTWIEILKLAAHCVLDAV